MKPVFADTSYWIAIISPADQWHRQALDASRRISGRKLVTTDEILTELLNYFAEHKPARRQSVAENVNKILLNENIQIIDATHENFLDGFELYRNRLDKSYSLTDCISMNAMREHDINEILTHDHHFEQEGFQTLL